MAGLRHTYLARPFNICRGAADNYRLQDSALAGRAGCRADCNYCPGCFIRAVYFGDEEKVVGVCCLTGKIRRKYLNAIRTLITPLFY